MARFEKLEFGGDAGESREHRKPQIAQRDERHWLEMADRHRRQGQYENALRFYSRALELDKSAVAGWIGQVKMLLLLDEPKEAELWSRKALELFPNNGELLAGRSQACCRIRDKRRAHALCDAALQQEGQSAYRWMVRGELMVAERHDADRHCFDKAQQIEPDWLVPLESALIYMYYGKYAKALPRAQRAVATATDAEYAWYVQGRCQAELGMNAQAEQSFQRCLELCPRHAWASQQVAQLANRGWSLARTMRRLLNRS